MPHLNMESSADIRIGVKNLIGVDKILEILFFLFSFFFFKFLFLLEFIVWVS